MRIDSISSVRGASLLALLAVLAAAAAAQAQVTVSASGSEFGGGTTPPDGHVGGPDAEGTRMALDVPAVVGKQPAGWGRSEVPQAVITAPADQPTIQAGINAAVNGDIVL